MSVYIGNKYFSKQLLMPYDMHWHCNSLRHRQSPQNAAPACLASQNIRQPVGIRSLHCILITWLDTICSTFVIVLESSDGSIVHIAYFASFVFGLMGKSTVSKSSRSIISSTSKTKKQSKAAPPIKAFWPWHHMNLNKMPTLAYDRPPLRSHDRRSFYLHAVLVGW